MAIENYSVLLEAELNTLLQNLDQARAAFTPVDKAAQDTGKSIEQALGGQDQTNAVQQLLTQFVQLGQNLSQVSENLNQVATKIDETVNKLTGVQTGVRSTKESLTQLNTEAQSTSRSTSFLGQVFSGIASTAGFLGSVLLKGGGLLFGLKAIREILGATILASRSQGEIFAQTAARVGTLTGSLLGFLRNLTGVSGGLGAVTGKLQAASTASGTFIRTINALSRNDTIFRLSKDYVRAFDAVESALIRTVQTVPGASTAFNLLASGIDAVRVKLESTFENIPEVLKLFLDLRAALVGAATAGSAHVVPGLGKVAESLASVGVSAGTAGIALSAISPEAAALASTISTTLLGTLLALDAAIFAVGLGLSKLGDVINNFSLSSAKAAGDQNQQFKLLNLTLKQTSSQINKDLGTYEDYTNNIKKLSAETGLSNLEIAKITTRLLQFNGNLQLSQEQLFNIIDVTTRLAVQFHDVDRVLVDVVDAFTGMPGPLRRLAGIEATAAEIQQVAAESALAHQQALEGVGSATEEAAAAQAVYKIITEGTTAVVQATTGETDNLKRATTELQGTLNNLNVEFGQKIEPIFTKVTQGFNEILKIFTLLPDSFINTIAQVTAVTGLILKVVGVFLTLGAVIFGVTQAINFLNLALAGTVTIFGFNLGAVLTGAIASFSGVSIAITNFSSLLKAVSVAAVVAFNKIEDSIGRFLIGIFKFDIGAAAVTVLSTAFSTLRNVITAVLVDLAAAIVAVGRAAVGVGSLSAALGILTNSYAAVIIKEFLFGSVILTAIQYALVLSKAITQLNEKYKIFDTVIGPVIKSLTGTASTSSLLTFALNKLAILFGGAVIGAVAATEAAALGVALAFRLLLTLVSALVKGLNVLTRGLLFSGDAMLNIDAAIKSADFTIAALTIGLEESGRAALKVGGDFFSLGTNVETAATKAAAAKKHLEEVVKPDLLEALVKATTDSFEDSFTRIDTLTNSSIAKIQLVANQRKLTIDQNIADETQRVEALQALELDSIQKTVIAEQSKLTQTKALIDQRLKFETDNINASLNKDVNNKAKRLTAQVEFEKRAIESERAVLEGTKQALNSALEAINGQIKSRVDAIRTAKQEIVNIESNLQLELTNLKLKGLDEDKRQLELRTEITRRLADIDQAILTGSLDSAKQQIDQVKSLISQVGADPNIAQAIASAAKLGSATTDQEVDHILATMQQQFGVNMPEVVRNAFIKINNDAMVFGSLLESVGKNADVLNKAIEKAGNQSGFQEQARFLTQLADSQKQLQERIIKNNQEGLQSAKKLASSVEEQIGRLDEKLKQAFAGIPKELEIAAKLFPEDTAVQEKIAQLRNTVINIPVKFTPINTVEVPGGSPHSFTEVASTIQKIFTPKTIPVTFGIPNTIDVPGGSPHSFQDVPKVLTSVLQPDPINIALEISPLSAQDISRGITAAIDRGLGQAGGNVFESFSTAMLAGAEVSFRNRNSKLFQVIQAIRDAIQAEATRAPFIPASVFNLDKNDPEVQKTIKKVAETMQVDVPLLLQPPTDKNISDVRNNISEALTTQNIQLYYKLNPTKIDIPGGSLHNIADASDVLTEVLTPKPIAVLLQGKVDDFNKTVQKTINSFANVKVTVPVNFVSNGKVDLKGFSEHPIKEVSSLLQKAIQQDPFKLGFELSQIADPRISSQAVIPPTNPTPADTSINRTVRVELAVNGITTPVNVSSEEDASALVEVAKQLGNVARTRGEYISPTSRSYIG